jgi:hypothetical protein
MNVAAMNQFSESRFALDLKSILSFMGLCLLHYWKKRRLYYYGLKFPGPIGFPFIGYIHVLKNRPRGK